MRYHFRRNDPAMLFILIAVLVIIAGGVCSAVGTDLSIVITQLPVETSSVKAIAKGTLGGDYGDGAKLIMVMPNGSKQLLSEGFDSACQGQVSFDGKKILFAGKKTKADKWAIYEMTLNDKSVRQVTRFDFDCRQPDYQSQFFTIISPKPWQQITFVGTKDGILNEYGEGNNSNLYSCNLDGEVLRQLTFNLSSDMDPAIMQDGRIVYAGWQRNNLSKGAAGRVSLFGINAGGTDNALFCGDEGKRIKHMPCVTSDGLVVFVEGDNVGFDGAGSLGAVKTRRPLHSYGQVTKKADGLFHSPSPLPDGKILVSRRSPDNKDTHSVCVLDPSSGKYETIFGDAKYHNIEAKAIYKRPQPDGRSSVVNESFTTGKLYCLNVYMNDLKKGQMPKGSAKKLRIVEGIAATEGTPVQTRTLGEVDVHADGSFNLEVPANMPLRLELLDGNNKTLRSCSWVWVKNREARGCIGCHEDGELTPENRVVDALKDHPVKVHPKTK